ncbi:tyrosine-type recombinase/integrase [Paenibacillus odorifer]|uniref:tyrosine-type recombinase/integrase n=1 Tax=Paenibacillus odorifer TaxID=189426 RepID=UPI00096E4AD1|nr:site-specific integrase [Paenibacillus odorifer]OMD09833.1 hypothetical protein BJP50_29310 [Paenibacillus odorifer]
MSTVTNNIQLLSVNNIQTAIESFLTEMGDRSASTKTAYKKDIQRFFSMMKGKEISQLIESDLRVTKTDVIRYRTLLKDTLKTDQTPKYKRSSINRFINSIRSLYQYLNSDGFESLINMSAFSINSLPENDSESAGEITESIFIAMVDKALTLENGLLKSLLIGLAGRTAIRLSALLALKWSDIHYINHGRHKGNWEIVVIDKGNKKNEKYVSDKFHQRLLAIKVEGQDRIFNISTTAVDNMIKRICKLLKLPEDNNISFHSLKGFAINTTADNGGTWIDIAEMGDHASAQTAKDYYLKRNKDYTKSAGYIIDEEFDINVLNDLNKMELLKIINDMDKNVQRQIVNKARERMLV